MTPALRNSLVSNEHEMKDGLVEPNRYTYNQIVSHPITKSPEPLGVFAKQNH
jgi:hypothetical protein